MHDAGANRLERRGPLALITQTKDRSTIREATATITQMPGARAASAGQRRAAELDFVRAALVAGVLLFHAVHVFDPLDFYVKSDAEWDALVPIILFASLWGMPLFFLLAGTGIWHSLRARGRRAFVRERAVRLLVPFAVGTVLLVPPQLHVERAAAGIGGSYADTLRTFFDVRLDLDFPIPLEGNGAVGDFEPAHLWFLAYLFAFSVVLLPLFWRLRGGWSRVTPALAAGVPIAALEAVFATEDAGGWNRTVYPVLLLYGFLLAAEPRARAAVARVARRAGWCGLAGFLLLASAGLVYEPEDLMTGHAAVEIAWRFLKGLVAWLLLLGVLGLIGRLRAPTLSRRVNEAVLPVYVLHQTVVVVLAWLILQLDAPAGVQLAALVAGTVAGTLALYELLRRIPGAGVLLGQRKRSSKERTSATEPAPSGGQLRRWRMASRTCWRWTARPRIPS
jgi:glucan biosynthesis protein C